MSADLNGIPDPSTVQPFVQQAGFPADLEMGPNGDLFYDGHRRGT